jgi:hypothetical protein
MHRRKASGPHHLGDGRARAGTLDRLGEQIDPHALNHNASPTQRSAVDGYVLAPATPQQLDLHSTPAVAVEALLRVEPIPHVIFEPCAGRGAIASVLRDHGHAVISSDIRAYDFRLDFKRDFFAVREMPADAHASSATRRTTARKPSLSTRSRSPRWSSCWGESNGRPVLVGARSLPTLVVSTRSKIACR